MPYSRHGPRGSQPRLANTSNERVQARAAFEALHTGSFLVGSGHCSRLTPRAMTSTDRMMADIDWLAISILARADRGMEAYSATVWRGANLPSDLD